MKCLKLFLLITTLAIFSGRAFAMKGFIGNIDKLTVQNNNFRKVISKGLEHIDNRRVGLSQEREESILASYGFHSHDLVRIKIMELLVIFIFSIEVSQHVVKHVTRRRAWL